MPKAPRITAAAQKRALASIQSDLRRLNIIKTNQAKLVSQIQQLVARYNQAETLASTVKKKVDDSVAQYAAKLG
ncbi:MAG: hypothetical protein H0W81_10185 [Chloroflexi bacterium]|nr:hypothetical protein [Chloroflexota bacterium]